MRVMPPQVLPETVKMPCYACEENTASHVCRYQVGELAVQVCLCPECMKLDSRQLLGGKVGIQGLGESSSAGLPIESTTTI